MLYVGCTPEKYERLVQNDPLKSFAYQFLKVIHAQHPALMTRCLIVDCRFDTVHNVLDDLSVRGYLLYILFRLNKQ